MSDKKLIYLIGPLSNGGTEPGFVIDTNTQKAMVYTDQLIGFGFLVHIPHLSVYFDGRFPQPYEYWMELDLRILSHCDAAFRMPGDSPGGDREEAFCAERDIPVFRDIEKIREWGKTMNALENAQILIEASKNADRAGDRQASLELVLRAAEWLRLAKINDRSDKLIKQIPKGIEEKQ